MLRARVIVLLHERGFVGAQANRLRHNGNVKGSLDPPAVSTVSRAGWMALRRLIVLGECANDPDNQDEHYNRSQNSISKH
jgi:hypothetical protein